MSLKYSKTHEWARLDNDEVIIGISDYAQEQLGDIVYVELPEVGQSFGKGEEFGTVESVKAVSELFMPVGGEVVAVNGALGEDPGLVNSSPYDAGFLIRIRPSDMGELDDLMTGDEYMKMVKG